MSRRTVGIMFIILGAFGLLVSLAANPLGLGSNPSAFGWLQTLGAAAGLVLLAVGFWLRRASD